VAGHLHVHVVSVEVRLFLVLYTPLGCTSYIHAIDQYRLL